MLLYEVSRQPIVVTKNSGAAEKAGTEESRAGSTVTAVIVAIQMCGRPACRLCHLRVGEMGSLPKGRPETRARVPRGFEFNIDGDALP